MRPQNLRRIGILLLVLVFGLGTVVHAAQAGAMAGKAAVAAGAVSSAAECQGCGGDDGAKDPSCMTLCAAVSPAVLPAKGLVVPFDPVPPVPRPDRGAAGLVSPPEPHPPKPAFRT